MPSVGNMNGNVLVIAGSTGIGKTALAITLAGQFAGEIVSADSRQIYRGMDIGTAKPTADEQARAQHHLIDVVDPDCTLTLAEYQTHAYAAIDAILSRGRLPLLVGGTGQYLTAVIEGWHAPEIAPDPVLRAELQTYVETHGTDALYARLLTVDPGAVSLIDSRNIRRVIRALEVSIISGQPFSAQRRKSAPPYRVLELTLTMDRATLDDRLDARIDTMLARGLLDEVRRLAGLNGDSGYDWHLPSISGLGYAQLGAYLRGEMSLAEAISAFKQATRLFSRKQYTWFRQHGSPLWVDTQQTPPEQISARVADWLAQPPDAGT